VTLTLTLTPRGLVAGLLFGGVTVAAWWTGNNLQLLVAAVLGGVWAVGLVGEARALRRVEVSRRPPHALWAGASALGTFDLRGQGASVHVRVRDAAGAEAMGVVTEDGATAASARWCLPRRGRVALGPISLSATGPFGLVVRTRVVAADDEVVVWPSRRGRHAVPGAGTGPRATSAEDVADLRPYAAGDPLRDVHALASARAGQPVVVVRRGGSDAPVWVEVAGGEGDGREAALCAAAGAIDAAWAADRPVGLRLDGAAFGPGVGPAWCRGLLDRLAEAP
jgi:uncharacterized protein (DUF58 family)